MPVPLEGCDACFQAALEILLDLFQPPLAAQQSGDTTDCHDDSPCQDWRTDQLANRGYATLYRERRWSRSRRWEQQCFRTRPMALRRAAVRAGAESGSIAAKRRAMTLTVPETIIFRRDVLSARACRPMFASTN